MNSLRRAFARRSTREAFALRAFGPLLAIAFGGLCVLVHSTGATTRIEAAIAVVAVIAFCLGRELLPTALVVLCGAQYLVATTKLTTGERVGSALVALVLLFALHQVFAVSAHLHLYAVVDPVVVRMLSRRIATTLAVALPLGAIAGLVAWRAPTDPWLGVLGIVVGAAIAATPVVALIRK